ncbi:sulfatase [Candidatus Litorirhabdus singularis]|nr:sulfatase [Candidatus Litorirhabdus singularis]
MRVWKWLGLGLLLVVVIAIAIPVLKLLGYEQLDDADRLAQKQQYLQSLSASSSTAAQRPNIVIILLDDLGYGDVGAYGAQSIATPHIDSLAQNGMRFSHYYSPSPVCSPSRAAMLTGRYPPRTGLGHVVFPEGHFISNAQKISALNTRIPTEEIMLSDVLKAVGYNTAMVGKWHMGDVAPSLPNDFSFDSYYGGLYSNDMKPFPLYRNRDIEEAAELDQTRMNGLYTREVVEFVESQDTATPFFLYYAHNFPHEPLFSSPQQSGKSEAGLYGDVVEDIDHSVGELLAALQRKGLTENTLIIFTSDNGPWYQGSPGFNRGRKNQTWEGGQRVPFIVHWPASVGGNQLRTVPISGVDLFPTLLSVLDLPLPADRIIDGVDISPLWRGESELAERLIYYYGQSGATLDAVRDSRFKYHGRRGVRATGITKTLDLKAPMGPWLFDLAQDQQESYDVSAKYPLEMQRLQEAFEARDAEFRNNLRGWLPVK